MQGLNGTIRNSAAQRKGGPHIMVALLLAERRVLHLVWSSSEQALQQHLAVVTIHNLRLSVLDACCEESGLDSLSSSW